MNEAIRVAFEIGKADARREAVVEVLALIASQREDSRRRADGCDGPARRAEEIYQAALDAQEKMLDVPGGRLYIRRGKTFVPVDGRKDAT